MSCASETIDFEHLERDAVHVHFASLKDQRAEDVEAAWGLLDIEECGRASRISAEPERTLFVVSHGLVRSVLGRYTALPADELYFRRARYGRPELVTQPVWTSQSLRFSLSHTAGLAGCAVAWNHDVGFDLERIKSPAPLEVAQRFFTSAELTTLQRLPMARQDDGFCALWTLKEAYLKATGTGLARPLSSFEVRVAEGQAVVVDAERAHGESSFLHTWTVDGCRAALALCGGPSTWRIKNFFATPRARNTA